MSEQDVIDQYQVRPYKGLKRNLSGVFFMYKNEPTVFEELPTEEKLRVCKDRGEKWLTSLAIQLAKCIRQIGDSLDIVARPSDENGQ